MFRFTLVVVLGCAALSARATLSGSYALELSPEARSLCRLLGMPEPAAHLVLKGDGSFAYTARTGARELQQRGRFRQRNDLVEFTFTTPSPVFSAARYRDGRLLVDGMTFLRQDPPIAGLWTLRQNGREVRAVRVWFDRDGTFRFVAYDASSRGRYRLEGRRLTFVWTEIDGAPVEGDVRQTVEMLTPNAFQIGEFRYER
jgi:hypothetical protein